MMCSIALKLSIFCLTALCVVESQKEISCPTNEEIRGCAQPPSCVTCESPQQCPTFVCGEGCNCKYGYLRDANGTCIPAENCPNRATCNSDEQFYYCPPSCKNTCEAFGNPGIRCGCGDPGCFCREGLVKRKDGQCVPYKDCDKFGENCPINEEIVTCSKPKWCNTCEIRGNCKLTKCSEGCDCKEDYYRNENSICILKYYCPPETVNDVIE